MDVKKIVNLLLLIVVTLIGDAVVNNYFSLSLSLILKCVTDSLTHFLIASLSWNYVEDVSLSKKTSAVLACGLFASLIDVDHFAASRTLNIQDATSLSSRPALHCTTTFVFVSLFFFLFSIRTKSTNLHRTAWIILTASLTHHLRDGFRRGIWICPIGSIPSFPYLIYLTTLLALPPSFSLVMGFTSILVRKSNIEYHKPGFSV